MANINPSASYAEPSTTADAGKTPYFKLIENYIYFYHTGSLIPLPVYPDNIADTLGANFNPTHPLQRSAPIYSYLNSGPRSVEFKFTLHRDLFNGVDTANSLFMDADNIYTEDLVDRMIRMLQAAALPKYSASDKMVDPPVVAVRIGNEIFCKGVISSAIGLNYITPILANGKYACVSTNFTVQEIEPFDAEDVIQFGGLRGIDQRLEDRIRFASALDRMKWLVAH